MATIESVFEKQRIGLSVVCGCISFTFSDKRKKKIQAQDASRIDKILISHKSKDC